MRWLTHTINYVLILFLLVLNVLIWLWVDQYNQQIERVAVTTFQSTEMEIVRSIARSVESYTAHEVAARGPRAIPEIEQEIFRKFVEPVVLLQHGDAWIYAPDHVVFDLSSDFPEAYRGKSMAEIFAMQVKRGATHYEEMTRAVMAAREGTGWYIWLPEKGREIAAWTPVRVAGRTWTIGISTPLPEIMAAIGASYPIRRSSILLAVINPANNYRKYMKSML